MNTCVCAETHNTTSMQPGFIEYIAQYLHTQRLSWPTQWGNKARGMRGTTQDGRVSCCVCASCATSTTPVGKPLANRSRRVSNTLPHTPYPSTSHPQKVGLLPRHHPDTATLDDTMHADVYVKSENNEGETMHVNAAVPLLRGCVCVDGCMRVDTTAPSCPH
jgi:hypothetical protein